MSPSSVIRVENLSKRYIIGHQRDRTDGLRHKIENAFRNPLEWLRKLPRDKTVATEEFWALKEVSFEVKQGEVVGIIGKNGAGKSTLLKILSRITEPTSGRIRINGRVASLLEVGTGFHQELTGRENIFLNGAILGMSRGEIKRKFDEIVAFSEIERFLDTPVKRYSSGMYVRLAFAVAAHLEPEVLIVDEVLAVGDAEFQKKCLGKMQDVATKEQRTVLFVSHNMPAMQTLCTKAIYLKSGKVEAVGNVESIVKQYFRENEGAPRVAFEEPVDIGASFKLLALEFAPNPVESGASLRFGFTLLAVKSVKLTDLSLLIDSAQNVRLALMDMRPIGLPVTIAAGETRRVEGAIELLPLVEGDYSVGLSVNTGNGWEVVLDLSRLTVLARTGSAGVVPYQAVYRGSVELKFNAKITSVLLRSDWRPGKCL